MISNCIYYLGHRVTKLEKLHLNKYNMLLSFFFFKVLKLILNDKIFFFSSNYYGSNKMNKLTCFKEANIIIQKYRQKHFDLKIIIKIIFSLFLITKTKKKKFFTFNWFRSSLNNNNSNDKNNNNITIKFFFPFLAVSILYLNKEKRE